MTERKYTDEEVVKGLEYCSNDNIKDCDACPYEDIETNTYCVSELIKDALDLINRQKAEIERLEEENRRMKKYYFTHDYHECHNEAIKEFAEELKEYAYVPGGWSGVSSAKVISERDVDNLVKEMTEEHNGKS